MICSTPGNQCLMLTQPSSYGSHTLCGLPQPEGRGAGAPWDGDWSPITTRAPFLLQLQASGSAHPVTKISVHSLCTPNASSGEDYKQPLKDVCHQRPVPMSACAMQLLWHARFRCFLFVPVKVCGITSFTSVAGKGSPCPERPRTNHEAVDKALYFVGLLELPRLGFCET